MDMSSLFAAASSGSAVYLKSGSAAMKVVTVSNDDTVTCEQLVGQKERRSFNGADLTTEDTSAAWQAERRKHGAF